MLIKTNALKKLMKEAAKRKMPACVDAGWLFKDIWNTLGSGN